jgi:hypothetical protein
MGLMLAGMSGVPLLASLHWWTGGLSLAVRFAPVSGALSRDAWRADSHLADLQGTQKSPGRLTGHLHAWAQARGWDAVHHWLCPSLILIRRGLASLSGSN